MNIGIMQKHHRSEKWLDRIAIFIATGGYCGYIGPVPGTNGSIVGLILFLPVATCSIACKLALVSLLCVIGFWASSRAERIINIKDAGEIVIDEIAGMWIAVLFLPYNMWYLFGAFILFRILDITKPFPAGKSQSIKGGPGIMIDDIIVGVYTTILLSVAHIILQF